MSAKVWIIDDDEGIRDLLEMIVKRLGYEVRLFSNPDDAIEQYKRGEADVIIADVRMPGIDGIEFTRRVHAIDPSLKVILLTGYPSISDAVEAVKAGAFDYLSKPVRVEEIRVRIVRALEARELAGRLSTNRFLTWVLIAAMPFWFLLGYYFACSLKSL